jgi:DNA-binding response OmpR family regulator
MPKILMIEDETAIREEVVDWLSFEDYDLLEAENGLIGLGKLLKLSSTSHLA